MVLALRNPPVTPEKKAAAARALVIEQEGVNSIQEGMAGRAAAAETSEADATEQHLLHIHRCRFLDWEPQTVVCMATSASGQLLAVARESGAVEIRLVLEKFRVVGVVPLPGKRGLIRALAWSQDVQDARARLFVGSLDTFISEIDVTGMRVRHRRDSYGGPIWCLAVAPAQDLLAVGCEDGSVKLFSTADNALEFSRALPTVNARVLSLAWQVFPVSSVPFSSSASLSTQQLGIFVGAIDGTIRHLDAATGHSAYRMTVEARNSVHPAMIWCLKSLRDGTLVSGDSLGNIHFWDGALGTLKQSFSVHEADVLALEAGPMGETVFASGVDSKLVCLRRQPSSQQQQQQQQQMEAANGKWVVTASNRAHSHDLRALALVRKSSGRQGGGEGRQSYLLVSGGEDTKLCTYSVNAFAHTRPRYIAPYPYHPLASLASGHPARLLLMQHDRKLHLWVLGATKGETAAVLRHEPSPVLEIQAAKGGLVTCSALSPDGRFLAYATGEELRVFEVEMEEEEEDEGGFVGGGRVDLQRWKPSALQKAGVRKSVTALAFSPDSKMLVLGTGGGRVLRLRLDLPVAVVEEVRDDATSAGAEGRGVVRLSCSQDGRSVAVGRWNGEVEIYSIPSVERKKKKKKKKEGGEAAVAVAEEGGRELTLSWRLPRLDSAPTALAYHPETGVLVIACVSNRFYLFDVDAQQLTGWSKDFGHRLPKELLDRHDCVLGICFNPDSPNGLILHGFGFVCYVDLDRPMGRHVQLLPRTHPAALAQREGIRKRNPPWVAAMKQKKQKRKEEEKKGEEAEGTMLPAAEATATAGGRIETPMLNGGGRRRTRGESIAEEEEMREQLMAAAAAAAETARLARRPANVEEKEEAWNFKLHLGYQGVLAVLALGPDEVLVVEEPWIKIVSKLPDVLHRQRYGT